MGEIEQVFQVESFCDDDNGACGFDFGKAGAIYIANLAKEHNKDSVTLVVPTGIHEFRQKITIPQTFSSPSYYHIIPNGIREYMQERLGIEWQNSIGYVADIKVENGEIIITILPVGINVY